ncbi:uncharacterized protein FIESC28_02281 [Fusarium coffeatum]|uniref:DNA2/NAM7 helicase-like C-terminal domain-containing protein n=1 Tax=Fusarium coffeatum TaxID=231269 RepID=A0A366S6R1_9HYPO|nr:uncharacterized protein FIESC28_02281 [Fusarium coffeatum]RBR25011.1 hypothetical protein FIESC28_02281 [Fusarium coffeatum]
MPPKKADSRACALWLLKSKAIIGGEALGLPRLIPNLSIRFHAPYCGKLYVAMVMSLPLGEYLKTTVFNNHAEVAKDLTVTLCFYKRKFQIKSADKLSDELCVLIMGQQDTSNNELFNLPAFCFPFYDRLHGALERIGIDAASHFPVMRLYSMEGEVSSSSMFKGPIEAESTDFDFWVTSDFKSGYQNIVSRKTKPEAETWAIDKHIGLAASPWWVPILLYNQGQCDKAFEGAIALISDTEITPNDIVMITPYRGNLECLESIRNAKAKGIPDIANIPINTTDSFQGRSGYVVILVLGVNQSSGPRFVANKNRLCVGTTRHVGALFVFGEVDTVPEAMAVAEKNKTSL